MIWNKTNLETLERLWNAAKTDEQIALIMGAKSAYSVAKARSVHGFVTVKHKKGIKRAPKTVLPKLNPNFTVLYYKQDGIDHFSMISEGMNATSVAQNLFARKGISEVFLLAPKSKVVMQPVVTHKVTEVSL